MPFARLVLTAILGPTVLAGALACALARHDLRAMAAGRMDPRGHLETLCGRDGGRAGILWGLVMLLIYFLAYGILYDLFTSLWYCAAC